MLIHAGRDRTVTFDLALAIWLALAAGAVNAAGFRALGFFSANMTGNVSAVADDLVQGHAGLGLWLLALVAAFVGGSFLSGLLTTLGTRHGVRGIYAYSILLEALLLIALALLDLIWSAAGAAHAMLIGLSAVMGLQNGASTRLSDGRVRTTHLSGIATDIGLGLAALLLRDGSEDRRAMAGRLLLHLSTLLAFFLGGIAGACGYGVIGPGVYLAVALVLLALALPQLHRARHAAAEGA